LPGFPVGSHFFSATSRTRLSVVWLWVSFYDWQSVSQSVLA
jgi:hypothetical protein